MPTVVDIVLRPSVVEVEVSPAVSARELPAGLPSVIEVETPEGLSVVEVPSSPAVEFATTPTVVEVAPERPTAVEIVELPGGIPTTTPATLEKRHEFALGNRFRVHSASPLYLESGGVSTLAAPIPITAPARLRRGAVVVDVADAVRSYVVEVLANGIVVESFTLPAGDTYAPGFFSTQLSQGDRLAARVALETGSGLSAFRNIALTLDLSEF